MFEQQERERLKSEKRLKMSSIGSISTMGVTRKMSTYSGIGGLSTTGRKGGVLTR